MRQCMKKSPNIARVVCIAQGILRAKDSRLICKQIYYDIDW